MSGIWITTYSGKSVDPFAMTIGDVDIVDIAHALSMQSRFSGHCSRFYSVAEHSVLVSTLVPRECALDALLHDAAEAYIGDVPGPVKSRLREFIDLETAVFAAVAARFGIPCELLEPVKLADREALQIEMAALMPPRDRQSPSQHQSSLGSSPDEARQRFLQRFEELWGGR